MPSHNSIQEVIDKATHNKDWVSLAAATYITRCSIVSIRLRAQHQRQGQVFLQLPSAAVPPLIYLSISNIDFRKQLHIMVVALAIEITYIKGYKDLRTLSK